MFGFKAARGFSLAATMALALALGACAHKADDAMDGVAGGYGAGGGAGAPGSAQEFTSSVGDRVFFDTNSTELNAAGQATLDKQAAWLNRYPPLHLHRSKATPTSAARANTISRSARRRAEATKEYLIAKGVAPAASRRSPTARNVRSRCATTSPAGRRIAAPSPCWRAASRGAELRRDRRRGRRPNFGRAAPLC